MSISWAKGLEKVQPYVFKIATPRCSGTGFQIAYSKLTGFCGIATALHVVRYAFEWESPIKITHYSSKETIFLREDRFIYKNESKDLAFILIEKTKSLKETSIEMIKSDQRIREGIQMGYCGFPALAPDNLCFFTGHVSSYLENEGSYLIDGIAINGVSGGPAFTVGDDVPIICGIVTAYIPNKATGESLPGVCLIRDVAGNVNRKLTTCDNPILTTPKKV